MTSSLDKTIDLRHYVRLIWRRKGIILLCWVVTLCATLIALTFVPREYESTVTLLIEDSQLLSRELEMLMGGIMQPPTRRGIDQERMAKLAGRIRSRPFLERMIHMLKMDEDPIVRARAEEKRKTYPEVSVEEMATRILVENLQSRIRFGTAGPGIYKVIVADYSAENAQILARWISELFVDISGQEALERIRAAHEFGAEQLRIYEQQLRRSEEALENYKQSIIGQALAESMVRGENRILADALYRRITDEASSARMRLESYSQALSELGMATDQAAFLEDPKIRDLAGSLSAALKNELMDRLAGQASEASTWPPSGAYGALRRGLLQQVEMVAAKHYPEASPEVLGAAARYVFSKVDLEAQQEAVALLRGGIAEFKREAESMPGGEIELTRLENDVATNRRLLQSFQAQLVASDVSQAVEMTKLGLQIEILDPAQVPLAPSRPNRRKILLASLLLGPLLGCGFAFVSETLDPVLRSLEDFARVVPEPVLGTTPRLGRLVARRPWIRRQWAVVALAGVVLVTGAFFVVRSNLLHNLATTGVPVQLVIPAEALNENPR